MSQKKFISNTFENGLNTDAHPSMQPDGTYSYALNLINRDFEQSSIVSNEHSNVLSVEFTDDIVGYIAIDERDSFLVFGKSGSISLWNTITNVITEVAKDSDFGCDWGFKDCEWIKPVTKVIQPCNELKVYWSSGCNYYHLNVDEMLNPKRKAAVIECEDCTYFNTFNCICTGKSRVFTTASGGTGLPAGAYQIMTQLEDDNGNTTNVFWPTEAVYLTSEDNQPGELSKQSISVELTSLDPSYDKVNIYLISTLQNNVQARKVTTLPYNSSTVHYDIQGPLENYATITIDELLLKRKTYLKGKQLFAKDGILYLYQILPEHNYNFQKHASGVTVKYETYLGDTEDAAIYKSLPRDEVLSLSIQYNYCDGSSSRSFPLIGPVGSESTDESCGDCAIPQCQLTNSSNRTTLFGYDFSELINESGNGDSSDGATSPESGELKYRSGYSDHVGGTDDKPSSYFTNQLSNMDNSDNCIDEEITGITADCINELISNTASDIDHIDPITEGLGLEESTKEYIKAFHETWIQGRENFNSTTTQDFARDLANQIKKDAGSGSGGSGTPNLFPTNKYASDGCTVIGRQFYPFSEGVVGCWISKDEKYPETKDCDGEYIYGDLAGKPIRHFRMPSVELEPHFMSLDEGVINKYDPGNLEWKDSYPIFLGLKIEGIELPNNDDLPKPLCPDNPYTIMYEPRTHNNRSVMANGIFTSGFGGSNYGRDMIYPKHALNSLEYVDQGVNDAENRDENGLPSKIGYSVDNVYHNFHSPDTSFIKPNLTAEKIRLGLELSGSGYRYDTQAKGADVEGVNARRENQRGTRQAINLTRRRKLDGEEYCLKGIKYADGNKIVSASAGIDTPLNNKWREQSVYLQTEDALPGFFNNSVDDVSFIGDALDHQCVIPQGQAFYGSLKRTLPNQYGNIPNAKYIPIGICPTEEEFANGVISSGPIGDTWIGVFSFRRTSYISNKVGEYEYISGVDPNIEIPNINPSDNKLKNAIKLLTLNSKITKSFANFINGFRSAKLAYLMSFLGFTDCSRLPDSGDATEPKNFATLRPGVTCEVASTLIDDLSSNNDAIRPEFDYYYPKTVKTLVHYWVESDVNLWNRGTGVCAIDEIETTATKDLLGLVLPNRNITNVTHSINRAEVYYDKLKCLDYDSSMSGTPWTLNYLNRFYCSTLQMSKLQKWLKILLRSGLFLGMILLLVGIILLFGIMSTTILGIAAAAAVMFPVFLLWMFLWGVLFGVVFSLKNIDQYILDLDECKTDSTGAAEIDCVQNWEDNYYSYNWDYSAKNEIGAGVGVPDPYNTCECRECTPGVLGTYTNEIPFSNKQILDSPVDSWVNFKSNNYTFLDPAAGSISNMVNLNNRLYAHTTDNIYLLQHTNVQVPTDIGISILGGGPLMINPQLIISGIDEGYGGLKDPNAAVNTSYGYFFLDRDARKLFKFDGEGLKEISALGMYNFFKETIPFCTSATCEDSKTSSSNYYTFGVDPRLNRLLFTKHDTSSCGSYTLSFDLEREHWVSHHSYIPTTYLWDRTNMYSSTGKDVWIHNSKENFQTYYGKYNAHILEFTGVNKESIYPLRYYSSMLKTEAVKYEECGQLQLRNRETTFNKLWLRNSWQSTGDLSLIPRTTTNGLDTNEKYKASDHGAKIDLVREHQMWKYSDVFDFTVDHTKALVNNSCCCLPVVEANGNNCDPLCVQDYNQRILEDDYMTARFTFTDDPNIKLYTKLHLIYGQVDQEVT